MATPAIYLEGNLLQRGERCEITIDGRMVRIEGPGKTRITLSWSQVTSLRVVEDLVDWSDVVSPDAVAAGLVVGLEGLTHTVALLNMDPIEARGRLSTNPPAMARLESTASAAELPRTDLTRWQYRIVNLGMFNAPGRMQASFAKLGSAGWELVTMYDKSSNWFQGMEKGFALFKRPVPAGAGEPSQWAFVDLG